MRSFSQTFGTLANQTYRVDFDLSRENGAVGNAAIGVLATGGVFTQFNATPSYLTNSYFFTGLGGLTTLTFSRAGTEGNSPLLDHVTVTLISAAIPEPATLGLLAMAGLALLARRRPFAHA